MEFVILSRKFWKKIKPKISQKRRLKRGAAMWLNKNQEVRPEGNSYVSKYTFVSK